MFIEKKQDSKLCACNVRLRRVRLIMLSRKNSKSYIFWV